MQKMKKVISFLLAFALVLSGMTVIPAQPVQAEETAAAEEYTIYPTPQAITYDAAGGTLSLPDTVNVVYESGIDQATKDRLEAVLAVKDITVSEVSEAESGRVNILVGIADSDGAAASYAENNLTYADGLFEKVDAYLLAIEANQITIVGKDTDAAFYAMASLKMILEQSEGRTVRQLQMDDYAVGQYRGFIEGYYGIPWSVEDRISLMNFGGDFKMNVYIFAPKDDPYHNTQWRDLYPDDKLADISRMVAAGTASKCRFVWAIHPFMNQAITLSNYDDTVDIVKNKFEQLYTAGVRQFVISADDAYSNPQVQVKLLNEMSAWVKAKGDCYNLVFVPMVYCSGAGSWYGSATSLTGYYQDMEAVDEDVEFMWTGEYVCHPATQYTFTHFREVSGREPFMWLNWPVNDVNHARLVMGPAENCILNTGGVTGFKGIVTNPLEQAEASKTSLFAIADYAWNTADFDCEKSWADCFQYIDEGASESLHEICKHLTNPQPGGITQMAESKEIQPYITAFQNAYSAGNDLTESGTALAAEFEKIINATNDFQENGTNVNLLDEMKPWVDALRETCEAGLDYVKTAMALQNKDKDEAIKAYVKGTIAYDASKKCAAPQLNNGTIMAESGAKVLMPFAESMYNSLKSNMEEVLKHSFGGSNAGGSAPTTEVSVIHNGLGGFYQGDVSKIIDGNESTFAWFNQAQTANAYIGLDLGDTYRINGVKILQGGANGSGTNDIFANAIVEYSVDGENYTQIETVSNTNDIDKDYTDRGIAARYVRIRTASASDKWYAIREFQVTTSAVTYQVYTNAESLSGIQADIQQREASVIAGEEGTDVTLKAGEYIGIELPRIREVTSITADYGENSSLVLESSLDGMVWEEVNTGEQTTEMSRIRIRNNGTADVTFKLNELSLTNSDRDARFVTTVECEENHDAVYAADNSLSTTFRAKEGSGAGSMIWRITNPEKTGPIYILSCPGTVKDAKVSVQTETGEWVDRGELKDGLTIADNLARYDCIKAVKIEWTGEAPEIVEIYTTEAVDVTGMKITGVPTEAIEVGGKVTITAAVGPEDADNKTVIWTSSNPEVAVVENGVITAVGAGEAEITVTTENGGYTEKFTVKVNAKADETKPDPDETKPDPDKTKPDPVPTKPLPEPSPGPIKAGDAVELKSGRYAVIDPEKKTAILIQAKNRTKASIIIPTKVKINGVTCKVTAVGDKAFKGFRKLKKITLTKNVTSVGKQAFAGCTKLSSVVVRGTGLKTIKTGAFKKTAKKMTVTFTAKKVKAKKRAALLKKMKKAGMSKSAKVK